jgi:hypothetical protein
MQKIGAIIKIEHYGRINYFESFLRLDKKDNYFKYSHPIYNYNIISAIKEVFWHLKSKFCRYYHINYNNTTIKINYTDNVGKAHHYDTYSSTLLVISRLKHDLGDNSYIVSLFKD